MSAVTPEQSALGRRVSGPSALTGDVRRFAHLTWTIAVQEFKLRFFGSVLGYLWQLMRPLLLFGVLYFVFTQALKIGANARFFPVVLLTNIVFFQFLAEATSGSVTSVIDRENIVRKIHFPRLVVPAAVVLTAAFNFTLNLLVIGVFMVASGVGFHWTWIEFPLLVTLLFLLAGGFAMLLSAAYVRLRDMRPIWDVVLQITFYATPIIYVLETIEVRWVQQAMMMNPLGMILQQVRHAVIDPTAPSAAEAIGGWQYIPIPVGIILLVVVTGFLVFNRQAPRIAEDL
jgi:ABC-2 type transport system permease protein